MNRYGKILDGSSVVRFAISEMSGLYAQVSAETCPEGYKPVERVLPYPTPTETHEIAFTVTDTGDTLKKEGVLIQRGASFHHRKFSKLKIYGAISSLDASNSAATWAKVQTWLEAKTIEGVNGWMAFQLAQDISEDHPLFAAWSEEARVLLGLTTEQFETLLSQCVLDA